MSRYDFLTQFWWDCILAIYANKNECLQNPFLFDQVVIDCAVCALTSQPLLVWSHFCPQTDIQFIPKNEAQWTQICAQGTAKCVHFSGVINFLLMRFLHSTAFFGWVAREPDASACRHGSLCVSSWGVSNASDHLAQEWRESALQRSN